MSLTCKLNQWERDVDVAYETSVIKKSMHLTLSCQIFLLRGFLIFEDYLYLEGKKVKKFNTL